jgi:hypothetical protein
LIFQWGLTDTLSAALPLHCIQRFETTAKHEHSATKVVAVSSALSPVVTARTVASERGVGGRISRSRTWCRKLEPLGVGLERGKPSVRSQAELQAELYVGIGGRISLIWTYQADSAVHLIASTVELVNGRKTAARSAGRPSDYFPEYLTKPRSFAA